MSLNASVVQKRFSTLVLCLLKVDQKQPRFDKSECYFELFWQDRIDILHQYRATNETRIQNNTPASNRQASECGQQLITLKTARQSDNQYRSLRDSTGLFEGGNREKTAPYKKEKVAFSARRCTMTQVDENKKQKYNYTSNCFRTTVFVRFGCRRFFPCSQNSKRTRRERNLDRMNRHTPEQWPILWGKINKLCCRWLSYLVFS